MPSLARIWIEFKGLDELDNKLKCLVYKIESSTSDEETRALILFSTHVFIALCQEFKLKISPLTMVDYVSLPESYEKWLKVIEEIANPDNSISLRHAALSVLQLLHAKSLFPKSELLDSKSCYLWQALFLLLTDDEPEIKQRASEFVINVSSSDNKYGSVSSVVPSKALELMLALFIEDYQINFPDRMYSEIICSLSHENSLCHVAALNGCICIPLCDERNYISVMLNWMLTSKAVSVDSMNDEQPFDKGEMNVFSEDLTLTDIVSVYIIKYLEHHKVEQKIFPTAISCWKDKFHMVMTFEDVIITCFEEASSIIDNLIMEANIPVISDTYFDLGLIQIYQRLSVLNSLLPFHLSESLSEKEDYLNTIKQPGKFLYEKISVLPFKTFFVESIMRQLEIIMK